MVALLVAFTRPVTAEHPLGHGSHVMEVSESPRTAEVLRGIQTSINMEYDTQTVLINWHVLPDTEDHPSIGMPYCYFVAYRFRSFAGIGSASQTLMTPLPVLTLDDLRWIEEFYRSLWNHLEVRLISCTPLFALDQDEMEEFRARRS